MTTRSEATLAAGPLDRTVMPQVYEWLTTSPNPRHPGTGYDAGQKGWRFHLVPKRQAGILVLKAPAFVRSSTSARLGVGHVHRYPV